jgi:peptidoglycan/LPS O-acetylase OafA/YrhL
MITVTWTIGTLMVVYTVVPACWAAMRWERWKPAYRILLTLAGIAMWQYMPQSLPMFNPRVTFLFVGFLLYEAIRAGAKFEVGGEFPALGILACGYVLWFAFDHGWTGVLHLSRSWAHQTSLAPGLFYGCGYVILGRGRLAACLERLALPRLGRMSYSYYLCHGLALKGLNLLLVTLRPETSPSSAIFWAGLPIAYACSLILAWVWFRLVETPLAAAWAGHGERLDTKKPVVVSPAASLA